MQYHILIYCGLFLFFFALAKFDFRFLSVFVRPFLLIGMTYSCRHFLEVRFLYEFGYGRFIEQFRSAHRAFAVDTQPYIAFRAVKIDFNRINPVGRIAASAFNDAEIRACGNGGLIGLNFLGIFEIHVYGLYRVAVFVVFKAYALYEIYRRKRRSVLRAYDGVERAAYYFVERYT